MDVHPIKIDTNRFWPIPIWIFTHKSNKGRWFQLIPACKAARTLPKFLWCHFNFWQWVNCEWDKLIQITKLSASYKSHDIPIFLWFSNDFSLLGGPKIWFRCFEDYIIPTLAGRPGWSRLCETGAWMMSFHQQIGHFQGLYQLKEE